MSLKPVLYCLKCALEAVIDDVTEPIQSCTNCKGVKFATREEFDRIFLQSVKIAPM